MNRARAPTLRLLPGGGVPKDKTDHALDTGDTPVRKTSTSAGEFDQREPCARVVGAYSLHPTVTQATLPIAAHIQSQGILSLHIRTWHVKPDRPGQFGTAGAVWPPRPYFYFFRSCYGALVTPLPNAQMGAAPTGFFFTTLLLAGLQEQPSASCLERIFSSALCSLCSRGRIRCSFAQAKSCWLCPR